MQSALEFGGSVINAAAFVYLAGELSTFYRTLKSYL